MWNDDISRHIHRLNMNWLGDVLHAGHCVEAIPRAGGVVEFDFDLRDLRYVWDELSTGRYHLRVKPCKP